MSKSLRSKLVFIMLLLIVLLMTVVLVFLIRGVQSFYTDEFYRQMETVFANEDTVDAMRDAAGEPDAAMQLQEILSACAGLLGIDSNTRNFYVLSGDTGEVLGSSASDYAGDFEITPNILEALTGENALTGSPRSDYMDIAVPIISRDNSARFVVYVRDNKQTAQSLNAQIFTLILEAVVIGFVISIIISLVLSKTLLSSIQGMTKAAEAMADGDFTRKIRVESEDEIGILSKTFNDMAAQIENMLEELKKAEKLRRDFVANVSHELRTPLTSVRTFAETIYDNADLPRETEEEFLRVVINECDRMTKIVQDLLELSRFDSGHSMLALEEFKIEKSVRDIYAAISLDAKKRGHLLNLELEWKLPVIVGDRARIEQVLMNIITNAVKYTPDGGTIDIYSGRAGENVWVKIQDTGVGIPQEDLAHVFDRFYRVDKARSRESGGTGLGLSIAQEIISRHDGDIIIDSTPGEGTTVTVVLPINGPEHE